MEQLTTNQKQKLDQAIKDFQDLCLGSFSMTRQEPVQKIDLPVPSMNREEKAQFQGAINEAINHALINQSGVLMNTLQNVMKKAMDGTIA